ncbi:MAG: DUF4286 family protein [Bacteroidetes bacterium]|nr:MAG: DUF4286 family protein [Bacteroidota bacterium]TAF93319.1 MAG: DUF4286 family protein [Bacteroidota bacterium]
MQAHFIYNVTCLVHHSIAQPWLAWMQQTHIPEVLQTQCFLHHHIAKVLEQDEAEGVTYTVQYFAASKADYNRYISLHATALRAKTQQQWGQQVVGFRTLMEIVH